MVTPTTSEKKKADTDNGAPAATTKTTESSAAPAATTPPVTTTARPAETKPIADDPSQHAQSIIIPQGTWPPPIYVNETTTEQEKYYIEHRWYAQWEWYDKRATYFKIRHLRNQLIIGIGSGIVPALVAINTPNVEVANVLKLATITLSLVVTAFTVVENVFSNGDNWRSYRGAAEDLAREKAMYDMRAGQYRRVKNPFLRFVERCEEIISKQNGQWLNQQMQHPDEEPKEENADSD